ncbi:MAG: hypothetical protein EAZ07_03490 [Cytophagales bacterium]|nr:MAG: hypothetical protein EAZ07_03490 [Cytophagales bacterium]
MIFFIIAGCDNNIEDSNPPETPTDTIAPQPVFNYDLMSSSFKELVKNDTAIIRGIDWNSTLSDVSSIEDSKTVVEQGDDYINYLIPISTNEQCDLIYYFNEAAIVQKIELNIYPQNEASRAKLYEEFIKYFNFKYGLPTSEISEVKIWNHSESNTYVEIRMLGNSKIHDLQIDIKNLLVNDNF